MTDHGDIDVEAVKARLIERRDKLERVVAGSQDDARPVELDQTRVGRLSRIDALQIQEMAKETERRRHTEIKRIDAALGRVEDGEYGACVSCGEDIAPKRLELDPAVPTCIDCAGG